MIPVIITNNVVIIYNTWAVKNQDSQNIES